MHARSWFHPLLCLLAATGCVPQVRQASSSSIQQLHRHTSTRLASEFPNGKLHLEYPFKLHPGTVLRLPMQNSHRIPAIPLSINHKKLPWILDTGANFPVLLDTKSATSAHLQVIKDIRIKGSGVGGNTELLLGRFTSLSAGEEDLLGQGIAGILLQTYHFNFAGIPVHRLPLNLLGLPFLEMFSFLTLDGTNKIVELGYQKPFTPPSRARSFPFRKQNGRLWVTVSIEGHPITAFFDTGYGSDLRLPACELAKLAPQTLASSPTKKRPAMGVGGVVMEETGQLKEARVGDLRITPVEYDTSEGCTEAMLGWGAFRNQRITIDFQRNCVWVESSQ
ncbi:MAG: retropepsin-like aspartic protease [Verrucomicrobiota bacterium]